ncbi:sulfotransferase family 2 domain-containing protein [Angustibacter luteus]|uniref:Sulfotransferase family 2 domain-containing protein n=1 Tax=Angustibacter luteus TaxID=658456 RepID=A0ABW1JCF9_9ACTN
MSESAEFSTWVRDYNGLAFLHPQWRLLFISVPKAAGTSLNIALTRSAGIPFPGRFLYSTGEESLVSQTIWDGAAGGRPTVDGLADPAYDRLMREGLGTVFTVVRHPVARLLSTWSSKYLVRAPYYRTRIGLPDDALVQFTELDQVLADLDRLVDHLYENPGIERRDGHLTAQRDLLRGDLRRFDHVGRAERLPDTVGWLSARLAELGVGLHPVGRDNESVASVDPAMLRPRTLSRMRDLAAADCAFLGYDVDDLPTGGSLCAASLPAINREIEHQVRAEVLHRAGRPRVATAARGLLGRARSLVS